MTLPIISIILCSVCLSVLAQILLKYGMSGHTIQTAITRPEIHTLGVVLVNPWIIGGLAAYVFSALFWLMVLSKVDVSRAYPFVGLGFIGTMLFAYFFLNEPLTPSKIAGTFLVACGVLLISQ